MDEEVGSIVRGVGFLVRGVPYETGAVDQLVFERLCELTKDPWHFQVAAGVHHCNLCRFTGNSVASYQGIAGKPNAIRTPGLRVSATSSSGSVLIPGDGHLFSFLTSITHYIDSHGFCPPAEFCEAVLNCPPMRSMSYFKALLKNGGRRLGITARGGPSGET